MSLTIAHIASEFAGLAHTGGLGDAVAALSKELARRGDDVRVFLPLYGSLDTRARDLRPERGLQEVVVPLGGTEYSFSVCSLAPTDGGALVYLIDCPAAYGRTAIYDSAGDEHLRFALLARAALESCQRLGWAPRVFHCHDWHAGLLPLYLETLYAWDALLAGSRTVLTIHNLSYQGAFPALLAEDLGLPRESGLVHGAGDDAQVNFLATGIRHADMITTVSPTYAREILTPECGMGLEALLTEREDRLEGILNGVDYETWDPEHDSLIPATYSATDMRGKSVCRRALIDELGLEPNPDGPVVGIVSRLAWQKGMDVAAAVLSAVLDRGDMRLAVLGTGDEELEAVFEGLVRSFPSQVAFCATFDEGLAHRIEAGSDMFLMPSRFEPCGLNQMYSLRYGTPPMVHRVGGLADTVEPFEPDTGEGTGFVFEPFGAEGVRSVLEAALATYREPDQWKRLVANGMARDFSWARQAETYLGMYERLLGEAPPAAARRMGSE
ncbi:MAG: glycogen synthase GlgA [Acidobacteriota bacterium]|nr:glycogen synthase GlgA [Acidobacteriota bacterium]